MLIDRLTFFQFNIGLASMEIYANFHKSYCLAIFERCEKLSLVLWNDLNNFLPYFELKNGITLISIERNLWDALQKIFYVPIELTAENCQIQEKIS